jgi:hypothetical protein
MIIGPVEHVIRTEKQKTGSELLGRVRHVNRSMAVDIKGMLRIPLTSVYVCVCGGEYDPIRSSLLKDIRNLLRVPNVGVSKAQPADIIIGPLAHERFAEQTSRPEDGYPHAAIL